MDIALYYAPVTCALVPYVNLTEAGATFEARPIDMRKGENKTPDYLMLNPLHKIPVLLVDGKPLTENVAIQIWIARNFPAAKLLPADPWQEVKAISLLAWCASGLHPHLSRYNRPKKYCDAPDPEAAIRPIALKMVLENFQVAEDLLAGRKFFFDHYTAVDAYFFWCFRRAMQMDFDLEKLPNCQRHFEHLNARASIQKVLAFEQQVKTQFGRP